MAPPVLRARDVLGRCAIGDLSVGMIIRDHWTTRVMLTEKDVGHCRELGFRHHSAADAGSLPTSARLLSPAEADVMPMTPKRGHEADMSIDRCLEFRHAMFRCRYLFRACD